MKFNGLKTGFDNWKSRTDIENFYKPIFLAILMKITAIPAIFYQPLD